MKGIIIWVRMGKSFNKDMYSVFIV